MKYQKLDVAHSVASTAKSAPPDQRCTELIGAPKTRPGSGSIGKKLVGHPISLKKAVAQIEGGGSVMPAGLVKGKDESDVLAYLATILGKSAA